MANAIYVSEGHYEIYGKCDTGGGLGGDMTWGMVGEQL